MATILIIFSENKLTKLANSVQFLCLCVVWRIGGAGPPSPLWLRHCLLIQVLRLMRPVVNACRQSSVSRDADCNGLLCDSGTSPVMCHSVPINNCDVWNLRVVG